jgi:type II secretory pathway pseudopilin PulG
MTPWMLAHRLSARAREEDGFTLIEALAAVTILAIGGFAVAQSLIFGLRTSGESRERLAARSAADQQMELARALNYDSLVLDDAFPLVHEDDADNPDYWVDESDDTYDHDGQGGDDPEPIVREAGASPALHHLQTPIVQGNTSFSIYMYVTWVDSSADGLGASDSDDGNGDGEDDSDGHDTKRTTVVVNWTDLLTNTTRNVTMSSQFSTQEVTYQDKSGSAPANQVPTVGCPTSSASGLTMTFAAVASDSDGTITRIDWDFGDGTVVTSGGSSPTHTYPSGGTYTVTNTVYDDDGASATNAGLGCNVTPIEPSSGPGPEGNVTIANGATYTTQTQVTLALSVTSGSAVTMQFSTDNATWSTAVAYNTSTIYTLPTGDGTVTVYARFINGGGTAGSSTSDSIILDTTAPDPPSGLIATSTTSGSTKTVTLSWSAPVPSPSDLAGYQVWKRLTSSSSWAQVTTCTSGTTCVTSYKKTSNYEFYVVAVDNAGNISAQSNHVTK